jgi:hypothetical protein
MKTILNGLLQGRITRWVWLATLLAAAGVSVGWMNQRHYQLGGAFIGNNGAGNVWTALQTPLDPAGRTAALRVQQRVWNADVAGFMGFLDADTSSDAVGQMAMISRDTARFGSLYYYLKQGNPPTPRAIAVMNGTVKFTGPDNIQVTYTIDVYAAEADADLDGYPDVGIAPIATIPGLEPAKRVPIP